MITNAVIDTPNGQLYLRKLCRHFAHKVPATFTHLQGRIEFPFGPCRIQVYNMQLSITIEIKKHHQVDKAEEVINRHLLKFANKDQPEIKWHRDSKVLKQQ